MNEKRNESGGGLFSTIRRRLALLLLAILVPILIVQMIIYRDRFDTLRRVQLNANLEMAWAVADTFQVLIEDLLKQELSIGLALNSFQSLKSEDIYWLLKGNQAAYPFLLNVFWIGPEGRILGSSDSRTAGADVSDRSFFREVASGRGWSVSNLSVSEETSFPIFTVSRAIRSPKGILSGVVVFTVLAGNLETVFPIERLGGGAIVIIDGSGRVVIRSPEVHWTWERRNLLDRIPSVKEALAGNEVTETIVDAADQKRHIFALAPIRSIGWVVGASRLEDQALAPVLSHLGRHGILFSLVVFLSVLVFLRIANSISNPLKRLQKHALDLGKGESKPLMNFKAPRELLNLAHALDFMADELHLKIEDLAESEGRYRMMNETLEQRVGERTRLAESRAKQLQALVSELTIAEQRERRRLAGILHDHLQQLLVAAKINAELLSKRIGEDQKPPAENIVSLITQSIQVSRSLTAELSPLSLQHGGLSAALEWLGRWMQENHGLTIELVAASGIDPEREDITVLLFQSIRELLFNVVKHAGVKSARIEISRDEESRLRVTVTDRGPGLDPDTIWGKSQAGTGFGLFSIRERLMMMGGSLVVESSPGNGASFSLIVPLEVPRKNDEKRIEKGIGEPHPAEGKIRVLLADDHTVLRRGLFTMINLHSDVEVIGEASDGEAAVSMARELQPDVILMDISMPRMNGLEATRIIHSEFPRIRIIGLSMYGENDLAAAMIEAGASGYCTKDGDTDALLSEIRGEAQGAFCEKPVPATESAVRK